MRKSKPSAPGFWESKGRNPALGAFIAVTIIVALYGLAGNFVLGAYMLGDMSGFGSSDWAEFSRGAISRYRAPILVATMAFEFLFFGAGACLVFRLWHSPGIRERFRLRSPSPAALAAAVAGAAGIFPLALLAGELFTRAFPFLKEMESRGESLFAASSTGEWVLLALSICLTPALCEELLFRGYLQGTARLRLKSPLSWILPGAYFALIHQNYFGLGALLIIGIYLAFVFEASGSIVPGMVAHFLYNGSVLLIANASSPPSWLYGESGFVRLDVAAIALPLAAAGIAGLVFTRRARTIAEQSR